MTPVSPAREAAATLLFKWEKEKAFADILYRSYVKDTDMDPRDVALTGFLFYGAVENLMLEDYLIASVSKFRLKKIHPKVLAILRLSVFQILFGEKLPLHAVLNDAVNLVARVNPQAKGFSNAVLRALSVYREEKPEIMAENEIERLSVLYSHPVELVALYAERLGLEECERMLQWNNSSPATEIRINTLKTDRASFENLMKEAGIACEFDPAIPEMGKLLSQTDVERSEAFREGLFTVQSKASYLAVLAGKPEKGETVIDVCSAPGGKSFLAAALMGNEGKIYSRDLYENKVTLIREGAKRLGITIIRAEQHDASVKDEKLVDKADLVICDVPCSGLGVISKKPDIKYKSMEDILFLPALQASILKASSSYVRKGGRIVYSTCTVNKAENEDIVDAFLKDNPEFIREEAEMPLNFETKNGERTLWPTRDATDGFYFCLLRRKG